MGNSSMTSGKDVRAPRRDFSTLQHLHVGTIPFPSATRLVTRGTLPIPHLNMPLPRVSLRSFLSTAKSALNDLQQASPITFVIGNESAGECGSLFESSHFFG
jgi:hypothetical protein